MLRPPDGRRLAREPGLGSAGFRWYAGRAGRLRRPASITLAYSGYPLIRRGIFEVFLWGGLAHANDHNWDIYTDWRKEPWSFTLAEHEFTVILAQLVDAILWLRRTHKRALDEIATARTEQ